jgi:hypothetical protein
MAAEIGRVYGASAKVAAVLLGGSVGRGWADDHSDIEIYVFYAQPPTEEERRTMLETAGGRVDIDWSQSPSATELQVALARTNGYLGQIWPYENEEWSEHYYVDGVNIGVSGFLVATMNAYLEATLDRHDPDESKQMLIAAIKDGVPLAGEEQLRQWQRRAAVFPDGLAQAIVQRQLEFDDNWWNATMLAERDDLLFLHGLMQSTVEKLVRILLGLNRIYLPDVRFKWLDRTITTMRITPEYLGARLKQLFALEPVAAVDELQALLDESYDLVAEQMPALATEVAQARRWLSHRRAVHRHRPGG